MQNPDEFEAWIKAADTMPCRYLGDICKKGWQSVGAAPVGFLPQLSMAKLRQKMHDKEERHFLSRPDWQGTTYETGPLARSHDHALVAGILEQYGTGLLARNVARLIELAAIPQAMMSLEMEQLQARHEAIKPAQENVTGISAVETARGRLVHSVKMRDGLIDEYRILAPTEWNFHPRGSAAKGLKLLSNSSNNDLNQQAQLFIEAIDPCVDFEVRIV